MRWEKEIHLDGVERVAYYDLGDSGDGSGDVFLGSVACTGHLKDRVRAQLFVRREDGNAEMGEKGTIAGGRAAPAPSYRSECGEGKRKEAPLTTEWTRWAQGPQLAAHQIWAESHGLFAFFFWTLGLFAPPPRRMKEYKNKLAAAAVTCTYMLMHMAGHVEKRWILGFVLFICHIFLPRILLYETSSSRGCH
jgi:hypothetical protein